MVDHHDREKKGLGWLPCLGRAQTFDSRPEAEKEHPEPAPSGCPWTPPSTAFSWPQSHVTTATLGSNDNSPAGEQEEEFIFQLQLGSCEI
jgi:hypothetical protein